MCYSMQEASELVCYSIDVVLSLPDTEAFSCAVTYKTRAEPYTARSSRPTAAWTSRVERKAGKLL